MKRSMVMLMALAVLAWQPVAAQKAPAGKGESQVGERPAPTAKATRGEYRQISWDDLIPSDWRPEDVFKDFDLDAMTDADPRAMELMQKLREAWDRAPVVEGMNGRKIRIPGYVVPLESSADEIREFLLVPYFGACIHVPPPPANQLIHVMPDKPIPAGLNMAPVWVSGVLTVARFNSDLGNAGYQLRGIEVEEYKGPVKR